MAPEQGRESGEKRAKRGIKAAAYNHEWDIKRGQWKMLKSAFFGPSPQVTTDCIDEDISKRRVDDGKWCGEIVRGLKRKKAMRTVGYQPSCRPHRSGGPVVICVIDDRAAAIELFEELEAYVADNPVRPEPHSDEFAGTSQVPWFPTAPIPNRPDDQTKTGAAD